VSTFLVLCLAILIDHLFGEAKHFHPLVGFGNYAKQIENSFNQSIDSEQTQLLKGVLSVLLAILPFYLLLTLLPTSQEDILISFIEAVILYFTIGLHSLKSHAKDIYQTLLNHSLQDARTKVALIVSRDTEKMQQEDISRATIESVLENGSDAVFAPIFWFLIAGIPGVVCYRIINTLDAMWGYKTTQFKHFGYAAAKLDDLLNYIPARLTALSYAMMGNWLSAVNCWKTQAKNWTGINPGVVMASGAGALAIKLGGGDYYHGKYIQRPELGIGKAASTNDILVAIKLINRVMWLWLFLLLLFYYPDII